MLELEEKTSQLTVNRLSVEEAEKSGWVRRRQAVRNSVTALAESLNWLDSELLGCFEIRQQCLLK
jgi:hypothetical protein